MRSTVSLALFLVLITALSSCDKGYRLRFANYHTERMDSVIVGARVMFAGIAPQQVTNYEKIGKGDHAVTCITASGRRIITTVYIPGKGSGDRTLQIDAIEQVSLLEQ